MVRAKFKVTAINGQQVELAATNSTEGDNKDWSQWTPSGSLSMCITNEAALTKFELGKCYWLDFTPVE